MSAITEAAHQRAIIDLAELCGWAWYHVPDSRRCPPGMPDLILCRPPVVLFVECKTDRGRLRPAQTRWLDMLSRCDSVRVVVSRPSEWEAIERALQEVSE